MPTGFDVDATLYQAVERLATEVGTACDSLLAPWQKLHALRTVLTPLLTFALNTAMVRKEALHQLDLVVKRCVKAVMNLPQRASAEMVPLPPSWHHFCGLVCSESRLQDPDARVAAVAKCSLARAVGALYKQPSDDQCAAYLSGAERGAQMGSRKSVWSYARTAARRLAAAGVPGSCALDDADHHGGVLDGHHHHSTEWTPRPRWEAAPGRPTPPAGPPDRQARPRSSLRVCCSE